MVRKVLVGMFLLGALFIFGLGTFYVENWQFYLAKGYHLTARFPLVHTLDEGDMVRLAGVEVGAVQKLRIDTEAPPDRQVEAILRIQKDVKVHAEDTAVIKIGSVFGGYYISIEPGDRSAPVLTDGSEIANTRVAASITDVVEESKQTMEQIKTGFEKAFDEFDSIAADLREGKGVLGRLIADDELSEKFDRIVDGLTTAADQLDKGQGVLGRLLKDEQLSADLDKIARDARATAENFRSLSQDLAEGKGTFGKLLTDEELYTRLNDSLKKLGEVADSLTEGEGALPMLLSDETVARDFRDALSNIADVSAKLSKGEGTAGKLVSSDEAYKQLMSALDDLKKATSDIAEGKGTLGKLVTDDTAYEQLKQLLRDVQGIVDAYREQSPVISAAGAIFGAF